MRESDKKKAPKQTGYVVFCNQQTKYIFEVTYEGKEKDALDISYTTNKGAPRAYVQAAALAAHHGSVRTITLRSSEDIPK